MKPFTLAIRAVGAQLALRLYKPTVIGAGVALALLLGGTYWLTTLSPWWWLLFIPLVSISFVLIAVAFVILRLIYYVRPKQNKLQRQAVNQFTDRLQGLADFAGTPKFLILFRVVRSIAAPTKSTYLANLARNKELASDFRKLQKLFTTR